MRQTAVMTVKQAAAGGRLMRGAVTLVALGVCVAGCSVTERHYIAIDAAGTDADLVADAGFDVTDASDLGAHVVDVTTDGLIAADAVDVSSESADATDASVDEVTDALASDGPPFDATSVPDADAADAADVIEACPAGSSRVGGACVPIGALRLLAPLSTATVTSQRPTLRWALPPGADGAHVQVCRDRACAMEESAFDATGSSGTPAAMLAPGVHFWRATGRRGDARGADLSRTWEFFVGHRSAPIDTSWGSVPDLNGDGYADTVINTGSNTRTYVFTGGAGGASTARNFVLVATGAPFHDGYPVGDLDGDGFSDLVVAGYEGSTPGVYYYPGAPDWRPPTAPPRPFVGVPQMDAVAGVGDVNRDGYGDLLLGDTDALVGGAAGTGRVYLHLGGPDGPSTTPALTLDGTSAGGAFGFAVSAVGDVNDDGVDDFAVGARNLSRVQLYAGDTRIGLGSAVRPSPLLTWEGPMYFGDGIAPAGDLNGDGYTDTAVGSVYSGAVRVFLRTSMGFVGAPVEISIPPLTSGRVQHSALAGGDTNGDGYTDLVVGDAAQSAVLVYTGGMGGVDVRTTYVSLQVPSVVSQGAFVWCHDVNGDGFDDVLVGAPSARDGAGAVYVFPGSATGVARTPSLTLSGTGIANERFGSVELLVFP